jgi:hypothetical protein
MTSSRGVEFNLVSRAQLGGAEKAEMFHLLTQHFTGVTSEQFARDLAEKNLMILLRRSETLVGFSTLLAYTTTFDGEAVNVIYSGDTIVTPDAWGTTALPRAWVAGVEASRARLPSGRCFWLLLTSGFRTYRFLPVFWRDFFPRFDVFTPPRTRQLLNHLAQERFGPQFDSARGIVRFAQPQKLRGRLNGVPSGRENDPHVAFFLSRNSEYAEGDELVCLTELCPENLTLAGRRMMRPQTCATPCNYS